MVYKYIAIGIVKLLRKNGIPAWVAGGVAVDIISGRDRWHKDIDIFIKDYSYRKKVLYVLGKHGLYLNSYNEGHRDFVVGYIKYNNNDYYVGLDVFYGSLHFGRFIPKPDINSITVDVETLLISMHDKEKNTRNYHEKALEDVNLLESRISPEKYKYKLGIFR